MNLELMGALNELEKERGIAKEVLFEAIEAAIVSAYKRNYHNAQNVRVEMGERGAIRVFARKDVGAEVNDPTIEIGLEEARKLNPEYNLGDVVEIEVTPRDFGRIAAQTAKQVVIQRIREAERALVYEEYSNREGDIVTGLVQRVEYKNVLVDLGKIEAVLPPPEQMPRESYTTGMRLKVYITEVRKTTKGPQVFISRTHPGLLKRLFELEVPEIHDGVVEIRAVAREAGNRSKIAVHSNDRNVDPVGACVGPRGMRVQAIVQELRGEKIDIVAWDADPQRFVANALSPARVVRVFIDEAEKTARAVVPDFQLSLAIGKEGQNARLAARLTGWKIDIKSETQMAELVFMEARKPKAPGVEPDETEERISPVEPLEETPAAAAAPAAQIPAAAAAAPATERSAIALGAADGSPAAETTGEAALAEAVGELLQAAEAEIEEEEAPARLKPAAARPKKSRMARRELLARIEEEQSMALEDEPALPSLFAGEEAEAEAKPEAEPEAEVEGKGDEPVFVVGAEESEAARGKKRRAKEAAADEKPSRDRHVLRDLSELARLLEAARESAKEQKR